VGISARGLREILRKRKKREKKERSAPTEMGRPLPRQQKKKKGSPLLVREKKKKKSVEQTGGQGRHFQGGEKKRSIEGGKKRGEKLECGLCRPEACEKENIVSIPNG